MKIHYKIAAAALMLGFAVQANAQVDSNMAQAAIGATIVAPLVVTKTADMDFGSIALGDPSEVRLSPDGTISSYPGATILQSSGIAAASFTVTGDDLAYVITLPSTQIYLQNETGFQVVVNEFTGSKGPSSSITGGSDTFSVGATLHMGPAQTTGFFAGSFDVVVNYQ